MLVGKPILSGESDTHQLELIFDICGTPTEETMPGWRSLPGAESLNPRPRPGNLAQRFRDHGPSAVSLLKELLKLDWKSRVNAIDALQHPYFKNSPYPANPGDLPTFEESHELDRRKFQDRRHALPPAPKGGTVGRGPADGGGHIGYNNGEGFGRNAVNGSRPPPRNRPLGEERVPGWQESRDRGLPPRPLHGDYAPPNGWDSTSDHQGGYRDRERSGPPRSRGGGGNPRADMDTYIPSYDHDAPRRERDDRRRRDDWDGRRHDWGDRRRGPDYDERARNSRTRSRSRSPIRDRERDRDIYRR